MTTFFAFRREAPSFFAFRREAPSFVRLDSISFDLPFQDLIFASECLRDYKNAAPDNFPFVIITRAKDLGN